LPQLSASNDGKGTSKLEEGVITAAINSITRRDVQSEINFARIKDCKDNAKGNSQSFMKSVFRTPAKPSDGILYPVLVDSCYSQNCPLPKHISGWEQNITRKLTYRSSNPCAGSRSETLSDLHVATVSCRSLL